jgi:hypothetical protein
MWSRAIGLPNPQRVRAVDADDPGFDAAAQRLFNPRTDVEAQIGATNLFS